jgi:inner membrane protein
MNRFTLLFKTAAVGLLTLLLLIPLAMINDTVADRVRYREEAVNTVAQSFAGAQTVTGPVLVLPYEDARYYVDKDGKENVTLRTSGRQLAYPTTLAVDGELDPKQREIGLHKVRVYAFNGRLSARFQPEPAQPAEASVRRTFGTPYLSIVLQDVRGLATAPKVAIGGRAVALRQGPGAGIHGSGVHAPLTPAQVAQPFDVVVDLALNGTETLAVVPVGDANTIRLRSKWAHPFFANGDFLPQDPVVNDAGFDARWSVTALSAASQRQFDAASVPVSPAQQRAYEEPEHVEVRLVEPVNAYSMADRASKYGVLFVALTFVGFFMFELIKRLPIHPIQYGLVGLALAIFFLLLLSLSEHIPFVLAYLAASAACIGLLGVYLAAVLRSTRRGLAFAAMLTLLYGALYGLLVSEDNALVLGSLLLFAILAAVMLLTRRIDWYALGRGDAAPATTATAA